MSPTGDFLPLLAESYPSETRSLCKALLLTKSMPPEGKQKTAIERTHLTGGKKRHVRKIDQGAASAAPKVRDG